MKVIDITEKLNFAEKPKIIIKDTEITVNNSAVTILKIMPKISKILIIHVIKLCKLFFKFKILF